MTMTSPPPAPALNGTLGFISGQLGMSVDSVKSALKGGSTIDQLAERQGVSADTLRKNVAAFIEQTRQRQQVPAIQPANLTRMLDRAFSHHRRSGTQASAAVSGASSAYAAPSAGSSTSASGAVSIYV
jgi:transposase-like protein